MQKINLKKTRNSFPYFPKRKVLKTKTGVRIKVVDRTNLFLAIQKSGGIQSARTNLLIRAYQEAKNYIWSTWKDKEIAWDIEDELLKRGLK